MKHKQLRKVFKKMQKPFPYYYRRCRVQDWRRNIESYGLEDIAEKWLKGHTIETRSVSNGHPAEEWHTCNDPVFKGGPNGWEYRIVK